MQGRRRREECSQGGKLFVAHTLCQRGGGTSARGAFKGGRPQGTEGDGRWRGVIARVLA